MVAIAKVPVPQTMKIKTEMKEEPIDIVVEDPELSAEWEKAAEVEFLDTLSPLLIAEVFSENGHT